MSTPPKTCKFCMGKGRILANSGNGRTETCPRCKRNQQTTCHAEPKK